LTLARVRAWRAAQRRRQAVVPRALQEFRARRGYAPMNGYVLHLGPGKAIVRVTYMTDHIPPDRAWFSVSEVDSAVRELTFADVAHLETPWR
jgi:hypothetical protein